MAFSYEEWKKRDNQRKRTSTPVPRYADWAASRTPKEEEKPRAKFMSLEAFRYEAQGPKSEKARKADADRFEARYSPRNEDGTLKPVSPKDLANQHALQGPKSEKARKADTDRFAGGYTNREAKRVEQESKARKADADRFAGGYLNREAKRVEEQENKAKQAERNHLINIPTADIGKNLKRNESKTEEVKRPVNEKTKKPNTGFSILDVPTADIGKSLDRPRTKKEEKKSLIKRVLENTEKKSLSSSLLEGAMPLVAAKRYLPDFAKGFFDADNKNDELPEILGAHSRLGIANLYDSVGGGINFVAGELPLGELGTNYLKKSATSLRKGWEDEMRTEETEFSDFKDPEYYARVLPEQIPQMAVSLFPSIGAFALGGKIANYAKLGPVAKSIVQAIGGASVNTAFDSTLEAGSVYEEALKRGWSKEDAKKAANEAFGKNLALNSTTSLAEFLAASTPLGSRFAALSKGLRVGLRGTTGGLVEAGQEMTQGAISADALGDEFNWTDPSSVEAGLIGFILGGGMTGGIAALTKDPVQAPTEEILTRSLEQMPQEMRAEFDDVVNELVDRGISQEQAREIVSNQLLETQPAFKNIVDAVSKQYVKDKKLQRQSSELNPLSQEQENLEEAQTQVVETEVLSETTQTSPDPPSTPSVPSEVRGEVNTQSAIETLVQAFNEPVATSQDFQQNLTDIEQMNKEIFNADGTMNPKKVAEWQKKMGNQEESQKPPATTQPSQPFEIKVGDAVNLEGTRKDAEYTVEGIEGNSVKVLTPNKVSIKVPKSRIVNVLNREAEEVAIPSTNELQNNDPAVEGERQNIINRLENVLRDYEADNDINHNHYKQVQEKVEALKNGAEFSTKSVAAEMIGAVGGMIPTANKMTNGEVVKPNQSDINNAIVAGKEISEREKTKNDDSKTDSEPKNLQSFEGITLARVDKTGISTVPEEKPQGLYMSIVANNDKENFVSPHDVGDVTTFAKFSAKNPLIAKEIIAKHARFGWRESGSVSSAIAALHEMVGDTEFKRLMEMKKPQVLKLLNETYPGSDYTTYHDAYDLLEVYSAQLGRSKGYDAFILEDTKDPEYSEVAVLKNSAITWDETPSKQEKPKQDTSEQIAKEFNEKTWYHGSRSQTLSKEKIDPFATKLDSLFGLGFYMTDDIEIAKNYAEGRKKRKGEPSIYEIKTKASRVLDLETVPTQEVVDAVLKPFDSVDKTFKETDSLEDIFQNLRQELSDAQIPEHELVDPFGEVLENLLKLGYDGYTHTGGKRTGYPEHRVFIMFDPNNTIKLKDADYKAIESFEKMESISEIEGKKKVSTKEEEVIENNRDTYVIERVGKEPFVVNRGDEVLQFIHPNMFKKVTVTSISHAKKEINGIEYGFFYPLGHNSKAPLAEVLSEVPKKGFINNTKIKVPKQYHHMIEELFYEGSDNHYVAHLNDDFHYEHGQTIIEPTQKHMLQAIRGIERHETDEPVSKNDDPVEKVGYVDTENHGKNKGETFTSSGMKIEFEYRMVEASDLIVSNDTDGKVNPNYPKELQPRDRTREASKHDVADIARKLKPVWLGESPRASDGAPIVGPDMVVESGNGRTMALMQMYKGNYRTAEGYTSFLWQNADSFGINMDVLETMNDPILVRVRTNDVDRVKFVEEANDSNVSAMSASEQATADAGKINNKLMTLFQPSENGDLNVASNRAFITAFMGDVVAKSERGRYMTSDGSLSLEGLLRVRNAVFAKAYGKSDAINIIAESTDNNVRNITNAMLQSAPRFAMMKDSIANGKFYNEDITTDIVEAMVKLTDLRKEGTSVQTFLNQTSMFEDLGVEAKEMLNIFDDKAFKRSSKALRELFGEYVNVLESAGSPKQVALFEQTPPTKAEILAVALKRVKVDENGEVQASLFETQSESSNETRTTGNAKEQKTKVNNKHEDGFARRRQNAPDDGGFNSEEEVTDFDKTVTRPQIIQFIQDKFKVTVGNGKTSGRRGFYKNKFHIMRTKDYGDFEVIAHELGHHIDNRVGLFANNTIKKELIRFAEANLELPKDMTREKKAKEGVAEYFRQVLYNEGNAIMQTSELSQTLHDEIAKGLAKMRWTKPINELRSMTLSWLNRDAEQELKGTISGIGDKRKVRRSPKRFMDEMYTRMFEEGHPIFVSVQAVRKATKKEIEGNNDAYALFRLTRGTTARAATFVSGYTYDSEGNYTGESLEKILNDVKDIEGFGQYLAARRGMYLKENRGKKKIPFTDDLMNEYLTRKKPEYEALADRIYAYQDRLLQVLVDGGLIPADLPARMKENDPYYVPFYRVMNETGERTSSGGPARSSQIANQQQGIKGMSAESSSRPIINPIESIVKNTHLFMALADRNSVGRALAAFADPDSEFASEASRDIIEASPPNMAVTEVALGEMRKTLLDSGLDEDIVDGLDMSQTAKIFSPIFKPSGSRNEILVWIDGKPKLFKVWDTMLYNALIAKENALINGIVGSLPFKLAKGSNQALRWGITASPLFTLKTFARSIYQLAVKTEAKGLNYFTQPLAVVKGFKSVLTKDDALYDWWASGGAQSTFIAVENEYIEKKLNSFAMRKKARSMLRNEEVSKKDKAKMLAYIVKQGLLSPFHVLQHFNDVLDQSLKIAEYQTVLKQTGGDRIKAAIASRDADADYRRMGSMGVKEFNQVNLFYNISFQGPDNMLRTFSKHKLRTTLRGLSLITLPTILLYLYNRDDEEYQELNSWEKDNNWNFPLGNGKFFKLPIPYEIGVLFKTIPEKLFGEFLDFVKNEDKQSWEDFGLNVSKTMLPSFLPTAANVYAGYKAEEDPMNRRPFVPMAFQGLEKKDQFDETTSEVMKWLGGKLDKSPMVLQETFESQFGQMGQASLWGTDAFLDLIGVIERPDTKGLKPSYLERYVFSNVNDGGTASITTFYKKKEELESAYESSGIRFDVPEELDRYRTANDNLKNLRKLKNSLLYDKIGKADGSKFTKDEKKLQIDTINHGMRDIARVVQGKDALNQEVLEASWELAQDYDAYLKQLDKEARKAAKERKANQ